MEWWSRVRSARYGADVAAELRPKHTPRSVRVRYWEEQERLEQEWLNDPGTPSDSGSCSEANGHQQGQENPEDDAIAFQKEDTSRNEDELSDKAPALTPTSPTTSDPSSHPKTPTPDAAPNLGASFDKSSHFVSVDGEEQHAASSMPVKLGPVRGLKRKSSCSGQNGCTCCHTSLGRDAEQQPKRIRAG
jgi:hypothetical protein